MSCISFIGSRTAQHYMHLTSLRPRAGRLFGFYRDLGPGCRLLRSVPGSPHRRARGPAALLRAHPGQDLHPEVRADQPACPVRRRRSRADVQLRILRRQRRRVPLELHGSVPPQRGALGDHPDPLVVHARRPGLSSPALTAAAAQQAGHQLVQSLHLAQQPAHFGFGEHDWQALSALGAQSVNWGSQLNFQYVAVEEKNGFESLVLRGSGDVAFLGQV